MASFINFDDIVNEEKIQHNPDWPYTPDTPFRLMIVGSSGSGKTNALFNLINRIPTIDKIYLYVKDPSESKYKHLIDKREKVGIKHFKDPKAFVEYDSHINNILNNIDEYNIDKDRKILVVFDDMIAEKVLPPQVTELFIRGRKMNVSLAFLTQSYFKVPKDIRLNCTHYYLMKIGNKAELRAIADRHSTDIPYKDFIKIYNKCTSQPYSFMNVDTTLSYDDSLRFRKNFDDCHF